MDLDYARGYPTDEANYRQLIKDFEENRGGAPQFLFNITMQNHGGYYASDYEWPVRVHEVSPANSYDESVIAYESSVHMADESVRQLISYFETVDEPTVVLFFGDHERAFPMNFTQVGLPTRTSSTWKPRLNFIKPPSSYGATTI